MKKEFAVNIALLLFANLFIKAFYLLGIDREMQLAVGTDSYGLYYNLLSFTLLFQFINDFGIQNYTSRYVSQNRESIHLEYKDFAGLKIFLSLFYILAVMLFAVVMNYDRDLYPLIFHLACNQVLVSAIFFIRSNIAGLGFYKTDSFYSVLDRILLILCCSFLLWHPVGRKYISIDAFVWLQSISLGITLLAGLFFVISKNLNIKLFSIQRSEMRRIFMACLPFAMIFLFSTLYNKLDVVLIAKLLDDGDHQAGIYAASMRLFEACSMISLAFGGLLLAMFSAIHEDRAKLEELFRLSFNLLLLITLFIVLTSCFYAKELVRLLYHHADPYWVTCFRLTMIAFLPASLIYIFGALLPALHKEKKLLQFYLAAGMLNFLLNVFFITYWKVAGAATVAIITQSFLFFIQIYYIGKSKLVEIKLIDFLRLSLFVLLSVLIYYIISMVSLPWIYKLAISGLIVFITSILMRVISVTELFMLRHFKEGM